MPLEEITEGLLLQAIPYLEKKKILKVFTPEFGLISLIAKSGQSQSLTTPFCIAEWVFAKKKGEIHRFIEGKVLDDLQGLKKDYKAIVTAGAMAKELLQSQLPHKKAPELYALSCLYLKNLPLNPGSFLASFKLKLLVSEGLFPHESHPIFTPEEWEKVLALAGVRRLSSLIQIQCSFATKIDQFFAHMIMS